MKIYLLIPMIFVLITMMTGCISDTLETPCPNFGANCKKILVNHWNNT